ncbi:uncharacterized protein [Miscanthus floridulus]|uniref:uncharacterized protein n=1 Tax=Miscanthus floridulus TaxID=154761 RepID=UPI0034589C39
MDKILAFSILSSSPADISAAGFFSTRLSWRTSAAGKPQTPQADEAPPKQEKAAEHRGSSRVPAPERQREARPRFAPEFDGLNCFESIVSS